ncbi:peptidase S16 [Pseudidiomarina sediminum]|uniref:Peptidase S16 n=1 Tax=Pseudidiomarina sediminum TaxID=431675 RepID=A0A432Z7E5_9GAMM|nr:LON peptidase substrate-binding domain-containing protein [Pseudidiomarina sediminum]MBY6062947.1 LON peptidase substrate-binding domain-containing protein [Pseudidiomarina sediminum]RUO73806.1 peptidase S16 [Pseudidiomarina sediminum]
MAQKLHNVPLFPLSGHVLPGGSMRLKIFEPRYLRMVREACGQEPSGLIAMAMLNNKGEVAHNTHIHPLATLANIVDFEQRDDGLLGITVQGVQACQLHTITTDDDGLRRGTVVPIEHWPRAALSPEHQHLVDGLRHVYQEYPELGMSTDDSGFAHADWVCLRWLEILPIDAEVKQQLLQTDTCTPALHYLSELVQASEQSQ